MVTRVMSPTGLPVRIQRAVKSTRIDPVSDPPYPLYMSRRVKTGLTAIGILLGCLALAVGIKILSAETEELSQTIRVSSLRELSGGRYLVELQPEQDPGKAIAIKSITRYPGGYAVVDVGGDGKPPRPPSTPSAVRTRQVKPGPLRRTVLAFGTVQAEHDAKVAVEATAGGVVTKVHVPLGAKVAAGAPLISLDPTERRIALRRARAELARATATVTRVSGEIANLTSRVQVSKTTLARRVKDLKKWTDLTDRGVTGGVDRRDAAYSLWRTALAGDVLVRGLLRARRAALVEARASVDLAKAARDAADLELSRCSIRAPFAGSVSERLVQVGSFLSKGTPVYRLVSQRRVRIRVHVREEEALAISSGATAVVSIPGVEFPPRAYTNGGSNLPHEDGFSGKVEGVAASADPRSRKFAVDVLVENPLEHLRTGMFARVVLDAGQLAKAILVPDGAIVTSERGQHVFLAEGDSVRLRPVVLGPRQGEGRILRKGIDGPAELVIEGTALLFDGAPITRLKD